MTRCSRSDIGAFLADQMKIITSLRNCPRACDIGCLFSRAWCKLYVFPRSVQSVWFPAYGAGCIFFRAWCRLYVFPRFVQVACFPARGVSCTFSRAWYMLCVFPCVVQLLRFPRLLQVVCFPAFSTCCMVPLAWCRLYGPRLKLVPRFLVLWPW